MANRYIDAILRFRDEFTGQMGQSVKTITEQEKHLRQVSGRLQKVGRSFTKAGKALTAGVTTPIVGFAAASVKTAAEFEASMSKVQSICGASGAELDALTQKAQEMGAKTKFSASESAEAFSYMAMAGWKTEDMLSGIEGVMYLAGATGEDLATTSDIVTDALTALGLTAGDTDHFVDVLAATANNANTNVSMLGESFKYVGPVAGSLGYSIDDLSAALGLMANSGIKASQAGTAMRSMLTNLAKPSKQVQDAMDALGISLTDASGEVKPLNVLMTELRGKFAGLTEAQKAQYAATIAGKYGMSGMLAIVNASDEDYEKLTGAISDCTGAAKDMYDVANDNLQGQLTVLKSTLESIMITVGNKLLPVIKKVAEHLQAWGEKLNGLNDRQVETILKIAGVAAVIGPVLLVIGKVITTVGKVVKAFGAIKKAFSAVKTAMGLLSPHMLIVIGVAALLAFAAYEIYKHWDQIKPVIQKVGDKLKEFGAKCKDIFFKIRDWAKKTFGPLIEAISPIISKIRDFVQKIIDFFVRLTAAILSRIEPLVQKIREFFDKIRDMAKKAGDFLRDKKEKFSRGMQAAADVLKGWYEKAKQIIEKVKSIFGNIISYVKTTFFSGWRNAWEGVRSIFEKIFGPLAQIFKKPINAVISLVNSVIDAFNSISFTVPDWVPDWMGGGQTFGINMPHIPTLAKGTKDFVGGAAMINEQGGEIVNLPKGAQVIPHDQSVQDAVGLGGRLTERRIEGQLIRLTQELRDEHRRTLPELRAQRPAAQNTRTAQAATPKHITIAKIADTVIVKEQADADALAETIAKKLEELDENCA